MTPWYSAVIVVVPHETAVARPALLTVAIAILLEPHVATFDKSLLVVAGEYIARAMNCVVSPSCGMLGLLGKRLIDCSTGVGGAVHDTVRLVCPSTPWDWAVMVVVPHDTAVASPELVIVATAVLLDSHVTDVVRLLLVEDPE